MTPVTMEIKEKPQQQQEEGEHHEFEKKMTRTVTWPQQQQQGYGQDQMVKGREGIQRSYTTRGGGGIESRKKKRRSMKVVKKFINLALQETTLKDMKKETQWKQQNYQTQQQQQQKLDQGEEKAQQNNNNHNKSKIKNNNKKGTTKKKQYSIHIEPTMLKKIVKEKEETEKVRENLISTIKNILKKRTTQHTTIQKNTKQQQQQQNDETNNKENEKTGTCGVLYTGIEKRFAFKQIHKEAMKTGGAKNLKTVARELQELHNSLSHPNIIQLYGTCVSPVDIFLILDYCYYGNLEEMMRKQENLPEPMIAELTNQLLNALAYIHERDIIHNDIKPSNLLMDKTGKLVVAHFGMANCMTHNIIGDLTHHNTYSYMSPERFFGKQNDKATDVFSLAMTIMTFAKGKHPFLDNDSEAMFNYAIHFEKQHVLADEKALMEGLSPEFCDFITQCDATNSSERQTVSQLKQHPFIKKHCPYEDMVPEKLQHTHAFLKKIK